FRFTKPERRLAARFAGKEAVMKSLGTGWRRIRWTDVEITGGGKPTVRLSGNDERRARMLGVTEVLVTITHTGETALVMAVAVVEHAKPRFGEAGRHRHGETKGRRCPPRRSLSGHGESRSCRGHGCDPPRSGLRDAGGGSGGPGQQRWRRLRGRSRAPREGSGCHRLQARRAPQPGRGTRRGECPSRRRSDPTTRRARTRRSRHRRALRRRRTP